MTKPRTVLELFAGAAGGWSVACKRLGWRVIAAAEADPDRRAAFLHNNPGVLMYDDVRDVTAERLLADLGELPDIVVASPPCQDISSANNGRAKGVDGERSGLYFEAVRIVGEVRPLGYAMENSPALKTRGADRVFDALDALEYARWPAVVGAFHAGFFHRRKRSWVAGVDAAYAARQPLGAAGQPRAGASGDVAYADDCIGGPARGLRQRIADARGGAAADADGVRELQPRRPHGKVGRRLGDGATQDATDPAGERCPRLDGPGPRRRESEVGAGLPPGLEAIERLARSGGWGGRSSLAEHYRMADGLRTGLARLCISAYGDAVVTDVVEDVLGSLGDLLTELGL